ncbi:hypothetical protein AVEN_197667-1 [Araneus ventricosus]|uniref:Uncharacterized protein n=1 Tax=Araneus ventricosus TaxID=182803 RepID=A0A4Y2GWU8_ARAVE|nr:hypothetical protein AVEN_197667-1 [Araneus ventricosus]
MLFNPSRGIPNDNCCFRIACAKVEGVTPAGKKLVDAILRRQTDVMFAKVLRQSPLYGQSPRRRNLQYFRESFKWMSGTDFRGEYKLVMDATRECLMPVWEAGNSAFSLALYLRQLVAHATRNC